MRWMMLVLVAVAGAAALAVMSERLQEPVAAPVAATVELPRYSVTGAEWVRLDAGGNPEMRARAAVIEYFADDSARLKDLTLDSLGGSTSPWKMQSPTGRVPPHERRVLLEGEVLADGIYGDEPVSFKTRELWVDLLRRELLTDARVVLDSQFRRASARGLRADFAGTTVQLLNDVEVEYVPGG